MNGPQLEKMLELIDANLEIDRQSVHKYIEDHLEDLRRQLEVNGKVEIPTSSGILTLAPAAA